MRAEPSTIPDKPGQPLTLLDKMQVIYIDTLNKYPRGITAIEMVDEFMTRGWLMHLHMASDIERHVNLLQVSF